jgi:hypothetical protein
MTIELSAQAEAISEQLGLDRGELAGLIADILEVSKKSGRDLAGNIVCGLDVNGPIVDCDDSELNAYPGASEAITYLIDTPGIEVTLCTGWDLASMAFFKANRLSVDGLGTVGEYGMVYERQGVHRYLYPYNEEEALQFVRDVLVSGATNGVKVAFQGNYSTGAGAIYIEGDRNGNLLEHPLVKGRRPSLAQLAAACRPDSEVDLDEGAGRLRFMLDLDNMLGLYKALVKTHPLISVRLEQESDGRLAMWIDDKDKEGFDFEALKEVVPNFESQSGRKALVYEDFGVDLIARAVADGNYSKDAGLREFGREAFGHDDFLSIIIGDKRSDIPKSLTKTLMAAQRGTSAEQIVKDENIPAFNPIDVRDFAVAVAEAHRIAQQGGV